MENYAYINDITNKKLISYTLSIPKIWLIFLLSIFQHIITVATPFLMIFMVTKLWFISDIITYIQFCIGFVLISILWLTISVVRDQLFYGMLLEYNNIIQSESFDLLTNLPFNYINNLPIESQFSRFVELENFSFIWLHNIIKPLFDLPLIILAFSMTCFILGFAYFACVFVIITVILFLCFYKGKMHIKNNPLTDAEYNGSLKDTLNNVHLINSHGKAKYFFNKNKEIIERKFSNSYVLETKNEILSNILESLLLLIYVCSLIFGVFYALNYHLEIQYLIGVLLLTWFSIAPFKSILTVFDNIPKANNAVKQFTALLNINKPKVRHKKAPLTNNSFDNISLHDISFNYGNGGRFIINKINLIANKGEILLINGNSGSGKSTLLKVLAGLLAPVSGLYNIGRDISTIDNDYLHEKIVLLSNNVIFENLTSYENLLLNQFIEDEDAVSKITNIYNLNSIIDIKLSALNENHKGEVLDKLSLAKLTVNVSDKIILIDEPLLSENENIHNSMLNLLNKLKLNNNIVIIASRYNYYSSISDNIVLMQDGTIVKRWSKHTEQKLIENTNETQ